MEMRQQTKSPAESPKQPSDNAIPLHEGETPLREPYPREVLTRMGTFIMGEPLDLDACGKPPTHSDAKPTGNGCKKD
jgi:hypothetical protein